MIVTPAIRKLYHDLLTEVIEDLHKPITAHMPPIKADCPNCQYDTANKKSSGVYNNTFVAPVIIFGSTINPAPFTRGRCPVCHDIGFLTSQITKPLKALVRWNPKSASDLEITPAGREGAPIVRIKVARPHYNTVMAAEYFTVDGMRCVLNEPATIRGLGTQEEMVIAFLLAVEVGSDVKR